jgi:catechol 2,3-dioxygenase-like lactoylglutathione lyase family enzyme
MQRLAMVSMVVPDYDEAIAFYVGVLGFELTEDTNQGDGKRWVVVTPPGPIDTPRGASLVLARADHDQRAIVGQQGGGRVWLFLHTDDFAGDHARMSAAGVRFSQQARDEPYGTVAVFEDCYGNRWDLVQPTSA